MVLAGAKAVGDFSVRKYGAYFVEVFSFFSPAAIILFIKFSTSFFVNRLLSMIV